MNKRLGRLLRAAAFHGVSASVALAFLLPLAWMVSSSLRQPELPPPRSIEWLPQPLAWSNYARIFEILPLGRYALNSLLVSLLAVPLTLAAASWAGLGMSLLGRRSRRRLLAFTVGLLMTPVTALWLTRYLMFSWAGWIDSYLALLAPALMGSSPLFILLFYWSFRRLPVELFDSARLDGAGLLVYWRRVALPLARPTAIAVSMLTFLMYWSDFISPLLYIKTQRLYTLAVGLQQLQQMDRTHWPYLMAASLVMAIPALIVFLFIQRYLLKDNPLPDLHGR
ncbi:MAG: carbohydrate ABC transporter permease [Chloroflexi bacterium]|nr:carbohydrate ABC transporter permease [Chloroflexota bacterium]